MSLDKAIKKIGKAMGDAKYGDAMGGAMLPHGELGTAQTLSILFGANYESVRSQLYAIMDAEYKRIIDKQNRRVRKLEKSNKKKKK